MKPSQRRFVLRLACHMVGNEQVDRIQAMPFHDTGYGFDPFGQERETGIAAYLAFRWLYTSYFRVESTGHENIPRNGRAILAGNHSGLLPFDGIMLGIDLLEKCDPPRSMRAIADTFLSGLPYISVFISRAGQVIGHRRNFEKLLESEELVAVFPEGAKGIGKPFRERYKLRPFNVGFIELSLLYQTPLIPFAVIGAEEQSPILFSMEGIAEKAGFPYFPITPTWPLLGPLGLFPYPVKYRIYYGEPVHYYKEYGPDAAKRAAITQKLASEFQGHVHQLVQHGLSQRQGIFR